MDPISKTFEVCDLDNNGLTFDEIQKSDCLEYIEQVFGIENLLETFLEIDVNKDHIITKQEGEDAASTNLDRSHQMKFLPKMPSKITIIVKNK